MALSWGWNLQIQLLATLLFIHAMHMISQNLGELSLPTQYISKVKQYDVFLPPFLEKARSCRTAVVCLPSNDLDSLPLVIVMIVNGI